MAIVIPNGNNSLKDLRGKIGRQFVVKQYGDKIVISSYPRKSKKKPSPLQKNQRIKFLEAVAYAKAAKADPEKAASYNKTKLKGQTIYHAALSDFMKSTRSNSVHVQGSPSKEVV
jgi:hypothetical protein